MSNSLTTPSCSMSTTPSPKCWTLTTPSPSHWTSTTPPPSTVLEVSHAPTLVLEVSHAGRQPRPRPCAGREPRPCPQAGRQPSAPPHGVHEPCQNPPCILVSYPIYNPIVISLTYRLGPNHKPNGRGSPAPNYFVPPLDLLTPHTDPWLSQGAWWSAYRFMHFC